MPAQDVSRCYTHKSSDLTELVCDLLLSYRLCDAFIWHVFESLTFLAVFCNLETCIFAAMAAVPKQRVSLDGVNT